MESDYWHSLDHESQMRSINPRSLGVSTSITKKGLDQLKARIFEGASNVELGFMGKEKGSLGQAQITPEMHSKQEREEIRQLAKINEVSLSTHATVGIGNTSGLTQQGFKDSEREKAIQEIKRTVDFAAETAGGGPIVVHTGEFQRPIYETEKGKFEAFEGEAEKAPVYFVDGRTGDLKGIDRDKEIPMVRKINGEYERDENGDLDVKFKSYKQIEEDFKKLKPEEKQKYNNHAEKYFYSQIREEEVGRHKVESEHYDLQAQEFNKRIKAVQNNKDFLEKIQNGEITQEQFAKEIEKHPDLASLGPREIQNVVQDPEGYVKEMKANRDRYEEGAASYRKSAESAKMEVESIVPIEEYGVDKTAQSLAKSAIYAYDKERTMKLEKPLFVAPENIFPEAYGSHPQELKNIVVESRKKMEEELVSKRGMNRNEAKKVAGDHIKATFDMGHANTWKKFFK
jgi:hypothetical protein